MKNIAKQDKTRARTPTDIERKYKFKVLEEVGDYGDEIELLKQNKVDKVAGKNLSSNDFTNGYKEQVEDNTDARHTHNNKNILDTFTKPQTEIDLELIELDSKITEVTQESHTHSNKELLDSYKQTETDLADAVNKKHEHGNQYLLDSYTNSNSDITNAIDDSHYHSNKSYLDSIAGGTSSISLSSYLGSGFSLLRGTCVAKNKRVCINAVVSGAISSRTTATIFDLPNSLSPSSQKDGVAFGTTSSGSTCGWYNVSTSGVVSVWFPEAVSTYTRVNIVYDLDY